MQSKDSAASLSAIFLVVFVDLLGFGILIPQLGVYAFKFQASAAQIGLLASTYSFCQFLFAPVLGRLSDRYGRRPILLYSIAGSIAGYLLFAFARSLPLLFLARAIDGVSGGNISTAQAYVADVTRAEDRAKGMGLVGAAIGLGFILGPGIGGALGAWAGNLGIGLGAALLSSINLGLVAAFLPESLRPDSAPSPRREIHGLLSKLALPKVGAVLMLALIFTIAFAQMEGTFSIFLITRHLRGAADYAATAWGLVGRGDDPLLREASLKSGYIFVLVGVLGAIVQGVFIGKLKNLFGEPKLAVAGIAITGLGLFLIPVMPSYLWLTAAMGLLGVGSALTTPALSSLVSIYSPQSRRGSVIGSYQAMGSLGRIIGPSTGGLLFAHFGSNAPYWVAASLMGVSALYAVSLARPDLPATGR